MTPEIAQERLGIGKSQYYEAMKACELKAERVDGKAQISDEQFQQLADYRASVSGGELTVSDHDSGEISGLSEAVCGEIPAEIDLDSDNLEPLFRRAAELKFQKLAGAELVTLHLAEQMDPEDFPPDIRQQFDEVTQAKKPFDPAAIASQLLTKRRTEGS